MENKKCNTCNVLEDKKDWFTTIEKCFKCDKLFCYQCGTFCRKIVNNYPENVIFCDDCFYKQNPIFKPLKIKRQNLNLFNQEEYNIEQWKNFTKNINKN